MHTAPSREHSGSELDRMVSYASSLGLDFWMPHRPLSGTAPDRSYFQASVAESGAGPGIKSANKRTASGETIAARGSLSNNDPRAALLESFDKKPTARRPASEMLERPSQLPRSASGRGAPQHRQRHTEAESRRPAQPVESLCLFYRDWFFMDDVGREAPTKSAYVDWQIAVMRAIGLIGTGESSGPENDQSEDASAESLLKNDLPVRRLRWPPANDLDKRLARSTGHDARSSRALSNESRLEFMLGWLERQKSLLGRELKYIVLMGEMPTELLGESPRQSDEFIVFQNDGGDLGQLFPGTKILSTPSSRQIWHSVELKRAYWKALRQLYSGS